MIDSKTRRWALLPMMALLVTLGMACGEDDPDETPAPQNPDMDPNPDPNPMPNPDMNPDPMPNPDPDPNEDIEICKAACDTFFECQDFIDACGQELVDSLLDPCKNVCETIPVARDQIVGAADQPCSFSTPIVIESFSIQDQCEEIGPACEALDTDYSPGADDQWDACISDDNTYNQIEPTISSIGRVAGFEQVADLLWRDGTPSTDDFLSAREIYAVGEGLDSRVVRREDEHYPPVSDGMGGTLQCRDEGVPAMDPQRCAGPGLILPIITEAFQAGITGEGEPEVNAARIEAALLWFMYVSSHKEAVTCTAKAKDCDSAYAYYTGGVPREEGLGLAGYIRDLDPDVHDRVWDGILAVRCWRDLDPAEEAMDLPLRDRAISQLDVALMHGVSLVVIDRALTLAAASGAEANAAWAFIQILGGVLDREATERDADAATTLRDELAKELADADPGVVIETLQAVFPCP